MSKITKKYRKKRFKSNKNKIQKNKTKFKKRNFKSQKGGIKIPFISGGNPDQKTKFEIPLENMNLEQLCLKAGFVKGGKTVPKTPETLENKQKEIQKDLNSTKELGGKLDASMNALIGGNITNKVMQFGNAMTWFPRKVANAAMNVVGINSNNTNNPNYQYSNNSNNNNSDMSNVINLDLGICSDHQEKLFDNCDNPEQFIDIYNKSVKKLKEINKIHFSKNTVDQINNISYINKNS